MTLGVPDPIVRKVTGHRSRELEHYQHLTPELRASTVNLIATELFRGKRARKERERGAHLPAQCAAGVSRRNSGGANVLELSEMLAGSTGLEPAASGVTGRRSEPTELRPHSKNQRLAAIVSAKGGDRQLGRYSNRAILRQLVHHLFWERLMRSTHDFCDSRTNLNACYQNPDRAGTIPPSLEQ
jgi:hypothetical protein